MEDKEPSSEKKEQSCFFDDLIIEEILTRLPVKSIIRFKSVSKHWYSTLSSSKFAEDHLMKSPLPPPSAPVDILFIESCNNCYLFSYDDDQISVDFKDNLVKLDVDFDVDFDNEQNNLKLTGCCNGLICLTPASHEYFIIWNPATRKLHKYGSDGFLKLLDEEDVVFVGSGFGYASNVDDYKYVQIMTLFRADGIVCDNIFRIFCLRENKWRIINFDYDTLFTHGQAILVNERLYWASTEAPGPLDPVDEILVSFDLWDETFAIINFFIDDQFEYLGVMGGCLSKCNIEKTFRGDKWVHILMESPGTHTYVKWVCLPKSLRLDKASEMIGFTRTDKFFVTGPLNDEAEDSRTTIGIVDTKPMQYTTLLVFDDLIRIARYVPSLVSPFPIEESGVVVGGLEV